MSSQVQHVPPARALNDEYRATISSSTSITIDPASEFLEISAINDGVFFLKGSGTVSTSNFHGYVAAGTTRHYYLEPGTKSIGVLSTSGSVVVITY